MKELLTTGQVANLLNTDRDAVAYAIRRCKIKPIGRAGHARVFSQSILKQVKVFLKTKRK